MRPRIPEELAKDVYDAATEEMAVDPETVDFRHAVRAVVDGYDREVRNKPVRH